MARLSTHPLPPAALKRAALRRIYETTPPTPRAAVATQPVAQRVTTRGPKPGQRALVGRYALERPIDRGGTATIYRAFDLATGEQRAVKLLSEQAAGDPVLRRCFLVGARAAMTVAHQNVVRVFAVHEPEGERPFAVMELLRGEPLNAMLALRERLPGDLVVTLARGAARGLHAAHGSGIVHADVKPENLFAVEAHRVRTLKILDFDLAWVAHAEPAETTDGPLLLRGTAKYMAPEQIVGDPVDSRTDVYALGVVLFRLLTGQLPFDLDLGTTLLRHQLNSPVPPPSWLVNRLDPRLDAVVVRATKKDPALRYQDMAELLVDLDAISLGLPLPPRDAPPKLDRYHPQSERARAAARSLGVAA